MSDRTRIVIVGAGQFANFIAAQTRSLPTVELTAVVDEDLEHAERLAAEHQCRPLSAHRVDELFASGEVDAAVIATPPQSHASLTRRALLAGLDVFCEKPLAMTSSQAHELANLADELDRVLLVDHVLRYNPILAIIHRIQCALGWVPVRFLFENDAADESLPRDHWFWDTAVSGGIFVEHGVHFFDAAAMFVSSPPISVTADSARRSDWPSPDMVTATVNHGDCLATHTHSFTHAHRCERQLLRIDYGAAEVRIHGWIPVEADITAELDDAGVATLAALLEDPATTAVAPWTELSIHTRALPRPMEYQGRGVHAATTTAASVRVSLGGEPAKQATYASSVAAALSDFHECRTSLTRREPAASARAGANALTVAEAATTAAHLGRRTTIDSIHNRRARAS